MNLFKSCSDTKTHQDGSKGSKSKNKRSDVQKGEVKSSKGEKSQHGDDRYEYAGGDGNNDGPETEKIKSSAKDRDDRKNRRRKTEIKDSDRKTSAGSESKEIKTIGSENDVVPLSCQEVNKDDVAKEKYENRNISKQEINASSENCVPIPGNLEESLHKSVKNFDKNELVKKTKNHVISQSGINIIDEQLSRKSCKDNDPMKKNSKYKSTKIIYTGDDSQRSIVIAYYKGKIKENIRLNGDREKMKNFLQNIPPGIEFKNLPNNNSSGRGPIEVYTVTVEDKSQKKKVLGQASTRPKAANQLIYDSKKTVRKGTVQFDQNSKAEEKYSVNRKKSKTIIGSVNNETVRVRDNDDYPNVIDNERFHSNETSETNDIHLYKNRWSDKSRKYENEMLDLLKETRNDTSGESEIPSLVSIKKAVPSSAKMETRSTIKFEDKKSCERSDMKPKDKIQKADLRCKYNYFLDKATGFKNKSHKKKNMDSSKSKDRLNNNKAKTEDVKSKEKSIKQSLDCDKDKSEYFESNVKLNKSNEKFDEKRNEKSNKPKSKEKNKSRKKILSGKEKDELDEKHDRPKTGYQSKGNDKPGKIIPQNEHGAFEEKSNKTKIIDKNEVVAADKDTKYIIKEKMVNADEYKVIFENSNETKEKANKITLVAENKEEINSDKHNKHRLKDKLELKEKLKSNGESGSEYMTVEKENDRRDRENDVSGKITIRLRNKSDKCKNGQNQSKSKTPEIIIYDSDNLVERIKRNLEEKVDKNLRREIKVTSGFGSDESPRIIHRQSDIMDRECNQAAGDSLQTIHDEESKIESESHYCIPRCGKDRKNITGSSIDLGEHKNEPKPLQVSQGLDSKVENMRHTTSIKSGNITKEIEKDQKDCGKKIVDSSFEIQGFTIKDLYLMENLKDYELELKERLLRKLKKSRRSRLNSNTQDQTNINVDATPSPHLGKLPSVKEIFKISNLADYEMKYKEMQERKKKRKNVNITLDHQPMDGSNGRKKITKFSLESKVDSTNQVSDLDKHFVPTSSHWLLNNIKYDIRKNGAGEVIDYKARKRDKNLSKNPMKDFEMAHRKPSNVNNIIRGLRTISKTVIAPKYREKIKAKHPSYLILTEKFRDSLQEDSRKLLETLSKKERLKVFMNSESKQSIKKKPCFQSDTISRDGEKSQYKFNYVLLKKSRRNIENLMPKIGVDLSKKMNPILKKNVIIFPKRYIKKNSDPKKEYLRQEKQMCGESSPHINRNCEHMHRNDCIFSDKFKTSELSYNSVLDEGFKELPERLIVEEVDSINSDNGLNGNLSSSSYTLSMFEKEINMENLHYLNTPSSNQANIKNSECKEQKYLDSSLKRNHQVWCHRDSTLERIIKEIEDKAEKDADSTNVGNFLKKNYKSFSNIEKKVNHCFSYISHINFIKKLQDNVSDEKHSDPYSVDESVRSRKDSSFLKEFNTLDCQQTFNEGNSTIRQPCFDCCRFCKNIKSIKRRGRRKCSKKMFRSSILTIKPSNKCSVNTKKDDIISRNMVFNDNNASNNVLHIKFCGQLNINFNKNSLEHSSVDEDTKQLDITYDLDANPTEKINDASANVPGEASCSPLTAANAQMVTYSESNSDATIVCTDNSNEERSREFLNSSKSLGRKIECGNAEEKATALHNFPLTSSDLLKSENPKGRIESIMNNFSRPNGKTKNEEQNLSNDKIKTPQASSEKLELINSFDINMDSQTEDGSEKLTLEGHNSSQGDFDRLSVNNLSANEMSLSQLNQQEKKNHIDPSSICMLAESTKTVNLPIYKDGTGNKKKCFSEMSYLSDTYHNNVCELESTSVNNNISKENLPTIVNHSHRSSSCGNNLINIKRTKYDASEKQVHTENTVIGITKIDSNDKSVNGTPHSNMATECEKVSGETNREQIKKHLITEPIFDGKNNKAAAKKKLLLTESEEEAFKYLLLKGIGRTDVINNNRSSDSIDVSKTKTVFSAIKRKLQIFRSKSDYSKQPSDNDCRNRSKLGKLFAPEKKLKSKSSKESFTSYCSYSSNRSLHDLDISSIWSNKHFFQPTSRTPQMHVEPHLMTTNVPDKPTNPSIKHKLVSGEVRKMKAGHPKICTYPSDIDLRKLNPQLIDCHNLFEDSTKTIFDRRNITGYKLLRVCDSIDLSCQCSCCREQKIIPEPTALHCTNILRQECANNRQELKNFMSNKLEDFSSDDKKNYQDNYLSNRSDKKNICHHQSHQCCQKQLFENPISNGVKCEKHCNEVNSTYKDKREVFTSFDSNNVKNQQQFKYQNNITEMSPKKDFGICNRSHESYAQARDQQQKKTGKQKFARHASKIMKVLFKKNNKPTVEDEALAFSSPNPQLLLVTQPKIPEGQHKIKKWLKRISQNKTTDFHNIQEKLFKKLNKIMSSDVTIPLQEVFDIIQKPQFQKDNQSYSGRKKFDLVNTSNYLADDGHCIMITEQLNVRGFLVSVGLKDDVAWEAQQNPELNSRLVSAITEARSWVNKVTMSQGLLIYILAVMTPQEVNNYFLQIVEAIINSRISNVGILLSVMMVLKRFERGKYGIKSIISKEQVSDMVPKQVAETEKKHQESRARFVNLCNSAKKAAGKINGKVDRESAGLLARLTVSYSPGLKPYLSLLTHYIAQKIITDNGQLAMAISYLQNHPIKHFSQQQFEQSCGIHGKKLIIKRHPSDLEPDEAKKNLKSVKKIVDDKSTNVISKSKDVNETDSSENMSGDIVKLESSNLERKASTLNLLQQKKKKTCKNK